MNQNINANPVQNILNPPENDKPVKIAASNNLFVDKTNQQGNINNKSLFNNQ